MGDKTCAACGKPCDMTFNGVCRACVIDDYDEPEGFDEIDGYEDCGLMPNGQCTKAGSEECDWECGRLH